MKNPKQWFKAAGIRAIRTVAQAAIALLPTTYFTLGSIDWTLTISAALSAGVLSLLTSIAGLPELPDGEEEKSE